MCLKMNLKSSLRMIFLVMLAPKAKFQILILPIILGEGYYMPIPSLKRI